MNEKITKTFFLTIAAGKRLIGRAIANLDEINDAMLNSTVAVIAGTTNSYVAEELLAKIGQNNGFDRRAFMRGVTLPPLYDATESGRLSSDKKFPGDVIIRKGKWLKNKEIHEIADELTRGDIIVKGANAANFEKKQAGILIAKENGGTIIVAMKAVIGRRAKLYLPIGLEKRSTEDLHSVAAEINSPYAHGLRYCVVSGEIISEIEAVSILTGAKARLIAAGGVCGAEGGIWLAISGNDACVNDAIKQLKEIAEEPAFENI